MLPALVSLNEPSAVFANKLYLGIVRFYTSASFGRLAESMHPVELGLREEEGAEVLFWIAARLSGTMPLVRAANRVRSGEEEGGVPMGVLGIEIQGVLLREAWEYE